MTKLTCFKAYDICGQLGDKLREQIAYRVGRAYAQYLNAKNVVVGSGIEDTASHNPFERNDKNPALNDTDGLNMEFQNWKMNMRGSNTEPLLRLNIEARRSGALVQKQLERMTALLGASEC